MKFSVDEAAPGVFHIEDAMGVCMTLLVGKDRALLVDAGYGLDDAAFLPGVFAKGRPVTLLLTHAHHDHALGARWFSQALLFEQDAPLLPVYTGKAQRERVLSQAASRGLAPQGDFLSAPMPEILPLSEGPIDLGGLTAIVLHAPGHTPGSAAVWVPERRLLLTGDAWNPCTWLFFPEALPVQEQAVTLRRLLSLPFERALCAHESVPYPRAALEAFTAGLTGEAVRAAERVVIEPYGAIDTRRIPLPDGQELIFDFAKADPDAPSLARG